MSTPPQNTITPCGCTVLGRGIVSIRPWVILVRGRESKLTLVKDPEHKLRVPELLLQQLVVLMQMLPVLTLDPGDRLAKLDVYAVVEIARQEANLVIHRHSSIAEPKDLWMHNLGGNGRVRVTELFEHICRINVALSGMRLSCCQMTVDKRDGGVVNNQACSNTTLYYMFQL